MAQLHQVREREEKRRKEKEEIQKKLQSMQEKLIVGGRNLLDEHMLQEQRLRQQARELEQKAVSDQFNCLAKVFGANIYET
jgi:hypothetical protein